jgi:hypothetical protein
MIKNHSPPSTIMDSCWYKLHQFTLYKEERHVDK